MRISLKRETAMGAYYGDNLLLDAFSKKVAVVIISFACFNVNFFVEIHCVFCLLKGWDVWSLDVFEYDSGVGGIHN